MGKSVLVAEDDFFIGQMIKLGLEEHGMNVELAVNGDEVIKSLDKELPNLLLLDLLMPVVDGFAVLEHINQKQYHIPIIILSNMSQEIDQEKCLALGAKAFFVKSNLEEDELWEKIQQYL
jgi:CheY-like chemotaxis protein